MPWRTATAPDEPAIIAMCLALNAEDPGPQAVDAAQVARTLAVLRAEPWRGAAAVLDEPAHLLDEPAAVLGYALLIASWSNELGGEVCTIDELYVAPAARGRGHASALVAALADGTGPWLTRPAALALEVSPTNPARALYERLGFAGTNRALRRRL